MRDRLGAISTYMLLRLLTIGAVLAAAIWSLGLSWQQCGWIDRLIGRSGCALQVPSYAPSFNTYVALSPAAPLLAVASANVVEVYEAPGGRLLHALQGPGGFAAAATFSPDGTLLAAASFTGVQIWDVASGAVRHTFSIDERAIADLAFAPDGRSLAAIDHKGNVWVWPLAGDQGPLTFTANNGGWIAQIVFLPDGRLVSCAERDPVRVWALPGGTLTSEVAVDRCNAIASAANGALAIDTDSSVQIWDLSEGRMVGSLGVSTGSTGSLAIAPDGRMVAISAEESSVQIWHVSDGQLLRTYSQREQDRGAAILDLAFSGDGRYLAANGAEHPISSSAVNVWRVAP